MSPESRRQPHDSWWDTWGKPAAYLLLGIVGVVGAMLLALILLGVIF